MAGKPRVLNVAALVQGPRPKAINVAALLNGGKPQANVQRLNVASLVRGPTPTVLRPAVPTHGYVARMPEPLTARKSASKPCCDDCGEAEALGKPKPCGGGNAPQIVPQGLQTRLPSVYNGNLRSQRQAGLSRSGLIGPPNQGWLSPWTPPMPLTVSPELLAVGCQIAFTPLEDEAMEVARQIIVGTYPGRAWQEIAHHLSGTHESELMLAEYGGAIEGLGLTSGGFGTVNQWMLGSLLGWLDALGRSIPPGAPDRFPPPQEEPIRWGAHAAANRIRLALASGLTDVFVANSLFAGTYAPVDVTCTDEAGRTLAAPCHLTVPAQVRLRRCVDEHVPTGIPWERPRTPHLERLLPGITPWFLLGRPLPAIRLPSHGGLPPPALRGLDIEDARLRAQDALLRAAQRLDQWAAAASIALADGDRSVRDDLLALLSCYLGYSVPIEDVGRISDGAAVPGASSTIISRIIASAQIIATIPIVYVPLVGGLLMGPPEDSFWWSDLGTIGADALTVIAPDPTAPPRPRDQWYIALMFPWTVYDDWQRARVLVHESFHAQSADFLDFDRPDPHNAYSNEYLVAYLSELPDTGAPDLCAPPRG